MLVFLLNIYCMYYIIICCTREIYCALDFIFEKGRCYDRPNQFVTEQYELITPHTTKTHTHTVLTTD